MDSMQKIERAIERIVDIFKEESLTVKEANVVLSSCKAATVTCELAGIEFER